MRLGELWGRCVTTAAAVAADQERIAELLERDPSASPEDIIRAKAVALKARQLVDKFTKQYLAEV